MANAAREAAKRAEREAAPKPTTPGQPRGAWKNGPPLDGLKKELAALRNELRSYGRQSSVPASAADASDGQEEVAEQEVLESEIKVYEDMLQREG